MQGDSIAIGSAWFLGSQMGQGAANASLPPTAASQACQRYAALCRRAAASMPLASFLSAGISMTSALPFDDFRAPDAGVARRATRQRRTGCARSLPGRKSLPARSAAWRMSPHGLPTWSGRAPPAINRPLVAIFAGNHGVVAQGISPRPMEATARAVELCAAGGAAINQVCLAYDLGLKVFDLALRPADRRHHTRGRARRTRLRRHHGVRHGGGRRRHRPAVPRRSRRGQFDRRRRDSLHALWRQRRRLGGVWLGRRRRR